MTDYMRLGRIVRRAVVLAGTAVATMAIAAAPANADTVAPDYERVKTYTAICSGSSDPTASGVRISMLGAKLVPNTAMRLTLMYQQLGRPAEQYPFTYTASYGQPYWDQGNGLGAIMQLRVSPQPEGVAASFPSVGAAMKAWYVVEIFNIVKKGDGTEEWTPGTATGKPGGYTHPVKAANGSEWCTSS